MKIFRTILATLFSLGAMAMPASAADIGGANQQKWLPDLACLVWKQCGDKKLEQTQSQSGGGAIPSKGFTGTKNGGYGREEASAYTGLQSPRVGGGGILPPKG